MESFFKIVCPNCLKINLVNNGDEFDLTVDDVDGVICGCCGHKWLLDGVDDWTDLSNANLGMGGVV